MKGCTCSGLGGGLCPQCQHYLDRARLTGPQPALPEPERSFQARVRRAALDLGYVAYHTNDSRGSDKGFPDLVLVRGPSASQTTGRCIFAELKTQTGKLTVEQDRWLQLLRTVPGLEVYLWRPSQWRDILTILRD